jgi:multiple sugar transport system substrate-binding protein
MVEGIRDEAVLTEVLEYDEAAARLAFAENQATYMRNWSYAVEMLARPDPASGYERGDFDYVELPSFEGGKPASVLGGFAVVIADEPRDRDAALALTDYLTRPAAVGRAARHQRKPPPLSASWDDPFVTHGIEGWEELEHSLERARPRPVTPAYPFVSQAIYRNVHDALLGLATPEQALRRAHREIERALAEVRLVRGQSS